MSSAYADRLKDISRYKMCHIEIYMVSLGSVVVTIVVSTTSLPVGKLSHQTRRLEDIYFLINSKCNSTTGPSERWTRC